MVNSQWTRQTLGSRTLAIGMTGSDVRELQNLLNTNGYNAGNADGISGPRTQSSVIQFQKDNGLTADGIVGSKTLAALQKLRDAGHTYTVKSGDTIFSIAIATGITMDQIRQVNGLQSDTIYPGQVLIIPNAAEMPRTLSRSFKDILDEKGIPTPIPNLKIVVFKSGHQLTLYSGDTAIKSYSVSLGVAGMGDKIKAGDHKTPEGNFYICQKEKYASEVVYLGTRWMRISYPNIEDADRGLASGLIDKATRDQIVEANNRGEIPPQNTALGGGVGIHGGVDVNGTGDWTFGCTALRNAFIEEFYDYVPLGTTVTIYR